MRHGGGEGISRFSDMALMGAPSFSVRKIYTVPVIGDHSEITASLQVINLKQHGPTVDPRRKDNGGQNLSIVTSVSEAPAHVVTPQATPDATTQARNQDVPNIMPPDAEGTTRFVAAGLNQPSKQEYEAFFSQNKQGTAYNPKEKEKKRWGRKTAAAGVATATVFTLAACTNTGAAKAPVVAVSPQTPGSNNPGQEMDQFYKNVIGPCMPQSGAQTCIASQTGSVAFINYGRPKAEVDGTVAAMKKYINKGSDGIFHPKIHIVEASQQAMQDLSYVETSGRGCVDIEGNPYNSPAVIAGYDMRQQLKGNDIVVALSDVSPCATWEAGYSDPNGRYADIFAKRLPPILTENGNKPLPPPYSYQVLGLNGAHEFFHQERQGHTAVYDGKNPDGRYSPFILTSTPRPFNLTKFLVGGNFDEYGEPTVMGSYPPYTEEPNRKGKLTLVPNIEPLEILPWQIDTFNELKAELENKPDLLHERTVLNTGLFISNIEAEQGRYGIAHLQKPVPMQSNLTGDKYNFSTIAFVPQIDQSVQIWLIDFDNPASGVPQTSSVNIGTLLPTTDASMSLAYNHQLFTINFQPNGVEIHSLSSN